MAGESRKERFTTLSPTVDDGRGQNTRVNPAFTDTPPDPLGYVPKEKNDGKEK